MLGAPPPVTRAWTDSNGNYKPDCDLLNPNAQNLSTSGGDICGVLSNLNFGKPSAKHTATDDHGPWREQGGRVGKGLIGVDDTTLAYVQGRPYSPRGVELQQALSYWRTLRSDPDTARPSRRRECMAAKALGQCVPKSQTAHPSVPGELPTHRLRASTAAVR